MRIKVYILIVLMLALFVAPIAIKAQAESAQSREYQIKAAFLYNFIKFVDWPEGKFPDSNEPIIIGIIGKDLFGDAFKPVKDKKTKGRDVIIRYFESFKKLKKSTEKDKSKSDQKIETLTKCHLLFICSSEQKNLKKIINTVKDHSVLTVADTLGFLEAEGIINFVMERKKVRFEINIAAAKRAKLKIRSNLLRLAKRIVEEKATRENEGAESP